MHGHKNWFAVLVFWFYKQQQSFAIYNLSQVYVQSLETRSFDPPITRILVICIENTHFADFSRISFWRKDELRYQVSSKIFISRRRLTLTKQSYFHHFMVVILELSLWKKTIWKKPELWGPFDMIKRKKLFSIICKTIWGWIDANVTKNLFP